MKKLPFSKDELLEQYKQDLSELLDDCDWIDFVDDSRICWLVAGVCEKKGVVVDRKLLLKQYKNKVKSLKLTIEEWREQYATWETGVPKIMGLMYEIIEKNA